MDMRPCTSIGMELLPEIIPAIEFSVILDDDL